MPLARPARATPSPIARATGWAAVIAAIAATVALIPPLLRPDAESPPPQAIPTSATTAPPQTTVDTPTAVSTPTTVDTPATFAAVRVHAADPGNIRQGARVIDCASCVGGRRVGYIGGPNILAIPVAGGPTAGTRTLTITYETEQPRTLKISVSGGPVRELALAGAASWLIPAQVSVSVFIPARTSWIKLFNDQGSAPDINAIMLQ